MGGRTDIWQKATAGGGKRSHRGERDWIMPPKDPGSETRLVEATQHRLEVLTPSTNLRSAL